MSFSTSLGITALRALLLVLLAMPLCLGLRTFLRGPSRWRFVAWLLLLAPAIAPRMLTGYGFANFSLSLVGYPVWNEILYAVLLLMTMVPIGTVMCYFAPPPPVSDEARHCLALAQRGSQRRGERLKLHWLSHRLSRYVPAAGLMLLLAFQEFELASLMGVTSWSVWLFDAQAGGLYLSTSLQYVLWPLIVELLVFVMMGWVACRTAGLVTAPEDVQFRTSVAGRRVAWLYLCLSVLLFCGIPWFSIFEAALGGLPQLAQNFSVGSDIVAGCLFAFLAASFAYGLAGVFAHQVRKQDRRALWVVCAVGLVPGLLGSLVLGLTLLFVFQNSPLHAVYGTPIPWTTGLVLFLVPRACLLTLLLSVIRSPEANHLVRLLMRSVDSRHRAQARELRWRSTWALHFLAFGLLFFWAYSDLTIASILAPPGLVAAPVRLYNLMHYGQSAVLSAMVVATFGVPALLGGIVLAFRRPLQRVLMP